MSHQRSGSRSFSTTFTGILVESSVSFYKYWTPSPNCINSHTERIRTRFDVSFRAMRKHNRKQSIKHRPVVVRGPVLPTARPREKHGYGVRVTISFQRQTADPPCLAYPTCQNYNGKKSKTTNIAPHGQSGASTSLRCCTINSQLCCFQLRLR